MQKIVIDIYGADDGIEPVIRGTAKAIKNGLPFKPVLVGEKSSIDAIMLEMGVSGECYEVINTNKYITNLDPPTCVFGGNDDTSMVMAYSYLKNEDECVAMLSPGNTGALLVGSICRLGLLPGLKFPALASALPCAKQGLVCLVDCGANTECSPNDLARFAKMGNAFSKSYCNIANPRIALLSVGREEGKGNNLTKAAFELIKELPVNFVGNVEGSDLVSGYADVIVCDGFSGNIILKNAEAIGKAAIEIVKQLSSDQEIYDKITKELFRRFDFNSQGGATFLGTKKTVVKMHGCANEDTTVSCIEQILRLVNGGFIENMSSVF